MKLLLAWPQLNEAHVETIQQETGAVLLRPADKDELPELVEHAEVIFGYIKPELLIRAVRCRWMQIPFAGVEKSWRYPGVIPTCSSLTAAVFLGLISLSM